MVCGKVFEVTQLKLVIFHKKVPEGQVVAHLAVMQEDPTTNTTATTTTITTEVDEKILTKTLHLLGTS